MTKKEKNRVASIISHILKDIEDYRKHKGELKDSEINLLRRIENCLTDIKGG